MIRQFRPTNAVAPKSLILCLLRRAGNGAMEAKGMSQAQLSRETTVPKSTISEILAGKKPLSRRMIGKFADYFGVEASVLAANC